MKYCSLCISLDNVWLKILLMKVESTIIKKTFIFMTFRSNIKIYLNHIRDDNNSLNKNMMMKIEKKEKKVNKSTKSNPNSFLMVSTTKNIGENMRIFFQEQEDFAKFRETWKQCIQVHSVLLVEDGNGYQSMKDTIEFHPFLWLMIAAPMNLQKDAAALSWFDWFSVEMPVKAFGKDFIESFSSFGRAFQVTFSSNFITQFDSTASAHCFWPTLLKGMKSQLLSSGLSIQTGKFWRAIQLCSVFQNE